MAKIKTAIIGSGNIGTDLMIKIAESSDVLEVGCVIGIDPDSEGLAMARERGFATSHDGVEGAQKLGEYGRTSGRAQCEYGDLRRAGNDTDGGRSDAGVGVGTIR